MRFQNMRSVDDMPFIDYANAPGLNASTLADVAVDPVKLSRPPRDTNATSLGRLFHTLTLEPETFTSLYWVGPDPLSGLSEDLREYALGLFRADGLPDVTVYPGKTRAGKKWAEFAGEHAGETILTTGETDRAEAAVAVLDQIAGRETITPGEFHKADAMAESVRSFPAAVRALRGRKEVSIFGEYCPTPNAKPIPVKGRVDVLADHRVADLKSTRTARPWGFGGECAKWRYLLKMAFYRDLSAALMGWDDCDAEIVACESNPHYPCLVVPLTTEQLDAGRLQYMDAVETWQRVNDEPPIHYGRTEIEIPDWRG